MKKISLCAEGKRLALDFDDHFLNLINVNQSLNQGAHESYQERGRVYVDVPQIVGITGACENVDTLFKVGNRLDLPLFFTQTGQLALEQALQSLPAVYTIIHSGRDEDKEDERHLRQFRLTEEEFDCTLTGLTRENYDEDQMYGALLNSIQKTVQSMIKKVLIDREEILRKVYKRNVDRLTETTIKNFLRIEYESAIKLLNSNGYPEVKFGDDLKTKHEAKIVELLNKKNGELPVFIMKYPKEIKFFNMKVYTKDERVVLSADLIFPYAGEGTGASVREHDFKKLNSRLITSTMYQLHTMRGGKYEDFKWYLDIIAQNSTNPHAGYGIGNERVLQYIFAEKDIRNVSIFSLLNTQTEDWSKSRYGQAAILSQKKTHVLLTIGKIKNKKFLLPHIKNLARDSNVILYTTEKTHRFLKEHGIPTSLVYKISEGGKNPNIADLLQRKVFDLVVNIPTRDKIKEGKEFTDGKLIRKISVNMGINLITDVEVAAMVIDNLSNQH